ncbi:desmin [Diretmus argenteus]
MSHSPERISSYRRHFEDSSSSSYQVRVSSPSPTRRDVRHASVGYSRGAGASLMRVEAVGRRSVSAARKSRLAGAGVSAGALVCVGFGGETAIDLDVAAAENQEFLSTRTNERREMIVLNDRLTVYIDKVRSLEQQNKLLEAEIEAYQSRFVKPTGLRLLYEEQLRELKKVAEKMRVQRDISLAVKESTAAQLEGIKIKYEEAIELRRKAELDIEVFRPDVDKATSARIALEKQLEQLEVKIEFLKRVQQQEIDELMKQIYAAQVSTQSAFALPDLAAALKQIQTQYDTIASKNLQEMDSWYKNKFEDITSKTSGHVDKVRSIREGIAGAKKDIQNKERDLESIRTKNEALEAQIRQTQEKYKKELEVLQTRIEALQLELKSTKEKIALHLRKYQDLLNVKMALEIEITTYRKLIEGEDLRLSGMSLTTVCMSAISAGMGIGMGGGGMGGAGGMGGSVGGMGAGLGGAARGVGGSAGMADIGGGRVGAGAGGSGGLGAGITGGTGTGGAGGVGAGAEGSGGVGTGGKGGATAGGVGAGAGAKAGSGIGFAGMDAGAGIAGSGGTGGAGMGLSGGTGGAAVAGMGGGIGGNRGTEGVEGMDAGGGMGGIGGGTSVGVGSNGYDATIGDYAEQAVELTERRTVLIRTVKNENDVLETDHQEQTYTISGAADDSDND